MLAWMDADAVQRTLASGRATYWSRSRQQYWVKGETSGHFQEVVDMRVDCDGDALLLTVHQTGPACHTGSATCFEAPGAPVVKLGLGPGSVSRRTIDLGPLFEVVADRKARPDEGSYTNKLLAAGIGRIAKKVGEEGVETALAAVSEDDDALAGEVADLLYHVVVLMEARGLDPALVEKKLESRKGKRRAH